MIMTLNQAVRSALNNEMEKNDKIVLLGEDIGKTGGVFRTTEGLYDKFGSKRAFFVVFLEAAPPRESPQKGGFEMEIEPYNITQLWRKMGNL